MSRTSTPLIPRKMQSSSVIEAQSRRPESIIFKMFWTPVFTGMTAFGTFYEFMEVREARKRRNEIRIFLCRVPGILYLAFPTVGFPYILVIA